MVNEGFYHKILTKWMRYTDAKKRIKIAIYLESVYIWQKYVYHCRLAINGNRISTHTHTNTQIVNILGICASKHRVCEGTL